MDVKRHGAHEIQGAENSPTLMRRNVLMIKVLEVVEEGQKSHKETSTSLTLPLRKAHPHSGLLAKSGQLQFQLAAVRSHNYG